MFFYRKYYERKHNLLKEEIKVLHKLLISLQDKCYDQALKIEKLEDKISKFDKEIKDF